MSLFGMKIYTAHIRPGEAHAYEKPVFVRESFNPWAFVFSLIWTLYHRLWLPALGIFAFNLAMIALAKSHMLSPLTVMIGDLGFHVIVGYLANDWLRAKLARRGFVLADITVADSRLRAEQRYFERYLATA